jgi:hypothetical protein
MVLSNSITRRQSWTIFMRFLLLIFISLISWPALALDMTVGDATTCASWLQQREKLRAWTHTGGEMPTGTQIPETWLIGFLEGYSWACLKDEPLTAGLDSEAIFERADRICRSTRTGDTPLLLVAFDLVKELDPQHSEVCLH